MRIALAQIKPIKGEISSNIDLHKKMINLAISSKSDAIFFPELSITSYEPTLAKELSTTEDDIVFDQFQELSSIHTITIGVGMPTKSNKKVHISMVIFQPKVSRLTYSKQQLHPDEFPYFVNGEKQVMLTIKNKKTALAICYESMQNDHSAKVNKLGAEIYVASVAKSQDGINKAMIHYPTIAKKFSMPVLMVNCIGHANHTENVGQSAVWTKNGDLAGQLNNHTEGILIFDTETELTETILMKNQEK